MFAKVHLGYEDGVRHPSTTAARPFFGQLLSERVHGMLVVHLWPMEFVENTRGTTPLRPLATLWRPSFSVALTGCFGLSGLERLRASHGWRWSAQRWMVEPMARDRLSRELEANERASPPWLKPGRVRP